MLHSLQRKHNETSNDKSSYNHPLHSEALRARSLDSASLLNEHAKSFVMKHLSNRLPILQLANKNYQGTTTRLLHSGVFFH